MKEILKIKNISKDYGINGQYSTSSSIRKKEK